MKKHLLKLKVQENMKLGAGYHRLTLVPEGKTMIPDMRPGQFVEVKAPAGDVLLRRPVSIHDCRQGAEGCLVLLIRNVGKGTESICDTRPDEFLDVVAPLGNGFSIPAEGRRPLLIGGGVGIAPLLYFAKALEKNGFKPAIIYGARNCDELVAADAFAGMDLMICTDDGSAGFHGLVTAHPEAVGGDYDSIFCCGPMPMMKAVAHLAQKRGIYCEVSLENRMACGLGACLCCVEKTKENKNVCVCTDGPVFDINKLTWLD